MTPDHVAYAIKLAVWLVSLWFLFFYLFRDHRVDALRQGLFNHPAAEVVARYQQASFTIETVTIYGRLRELKDQSLEEEEGKYFTGEIVREGQEVWRVRFRASDKEKAASLWSKQVYVTGSALYYRMASPKILAEEFGLDEPRDYEAAFDELYGLHADLYKADLKTLLAELRGGQFEDVHIPCWRRVILAVARRWGFE